MNRQRTALFLTFVLLLTWTVAHAASSVLYLPLVNSSAVPTPIPTLAPTTVPICDIGHCVDNPVPLGQELIIGGVAYQVRFSERPTLRIPDAFTPAAGKQQVGVAVSGRCVTVSVFGDCSVSGLYFKATSNSRGLYDLAPGALLMKGWIGQVSLLQGGEHEGWVAYEIPHSDPDVVLVYDWIEGKYFFRVP